MQFEARPSRPHSLLTPIENFLERHAIAIQKTRIDKEAHELAEILLKIPRRGKSVLHEDDTVVLPDGRNVHIKLCNTANATTLKQLLDAHHRADRIDLSISGAKNPQHNYSISVDFTGKDKLNDYREYYGGGVQMGCVFQSSIQPEGYAAFLNGNQIPFDTAMQVHVYRQVADIFHSVRMAFIGGTVSQIAP